MTTTKRRPSRDAYWAQLDRALPRFAPEEQEVAMAIYRELMKGEGVVAADLTAALGRDEAQVAELLERPAVAALSYRVEGRIQGFGGLAAREMSHRFRVAGRLLWTWCAWDSLFLPELLGEVAEVESADPTTGEPVRLRVSPAGVEALERGSTVVSFVVPDPDVLQTSAENVMTAFCHFVHFFASPESGQAWVESRPGTFLFSLDDATDLARRLNRRNFGHVLGGVDRERAFNGDGDR